MSAPTSIWGPLFPLFFLLALAKGLEPFFKPKRRSRSSRPSTAKAPSAPASPRRNTSPSSDLIGWWGEIKVRLGLWLFLNHQTYHRLHNVIIPADNGTSQIDHILVSIHGIFVIETKNQKGWIFGDEKSRQWTQSIYGNRYFFQNPLHQNYRHTQCLANFLKLDHDVFRSVVFFIGDCTFQTPMPPNVRNRRLFSYLRSFQTPLLSPAQVAQIVQRLTAEKAAPAATARQHVHSLHARFDSTVTCPKCSGALVGRVARRGANTGSAFLGCKNYPRCKFTRPTA